MAVYLFQCPRCADAFIASPCAPSARRRTAAAARYAPLNMSSTCTTHGTFDVPSMLCALPTSLPHRTLCSKPAPSPITCNTFPAYMPSTKTLSTASSPSRTTTTTHTACRGHILITDPYYILAGPSPRPSASRPLCGRKVVRPSRARTPRESSGIQRDTPRGLQTRGDQEEEERHATCCAY